MWNSKFCYKVKYGEFSSLTGTSARGWLKKYRSKLEPNLLNLQKVIYAKREHPLYYLDKELRAFITHFQQLNFRRVLF